MRPVIVPPLTRFAGLLTTPEAVGFRYDRWACPAARISSVSMNNSVHEQVPDGRSLADEGLVRWGSEVRRSVGPSCREAGAQRLRASAQARWDSRPRGPELPLVQNLRTDQGLAVRLYRPTLDLRPTVLYLHGGGFVMGDLESHDGLCRRLARIADVTVLAVDYRLPPEHPGPTAVEDAVGTFVWAREHLQELGGDPEAGVALAGDSSGGALAVLAAVSLYACGMTPSALLLAYPNADMTLRGDSVTQEVHGWVLEADDLRWFVEQWLPDPDWCDDPQVSPAHADLTDARCTARSYRALAVLHPLWWRLCEATGAIALTPQPVGRHGERPWPGDVDYCLQRRVIEIRDGVLALRPYLGLSDPDRTKDALVLLGVSERDRALVAEAAWLEVARRAKLAGVQPTSDQVRTTAGAVDLAGEIRSLTRIAKNLPVVDAAADLLDDSRKIRV